MTYSGEERRENAFTPRDRKVLRDVDAKVTLINGTVQRHDEEIFGDDKKRKKGLRTEMDEMQIFKTQIKTGIVVIVTLLSIIGISNIILLFRTS